MALLIKIQNIHFSYAPHNKLFDGLSLSFEPHGIYGLLGCNGSGKTSLLNLVSGLSFPQKGQITLLGEPAAARSVTALQKVFYFPEEFMLPPLAARLYGALMGKFYPGFDPAKFHRLLTRLDIDSRARLTKLSLGQKKRFMLAFALAVNPALLIMDEPTNGLDIPGKALCRELIAEVDLSQTTVIVSTHQIHDISTLLTHATMIDGGDILFNCSIEKISGSFDFSMADTPPADDPVVLYSEKDGTRSRVLRLRSADQPPSQQMDIELLFNAALKNRQRITQLLKAEEAP
jgi:ABC-2 type transport system ATP-binding protein